MRTESRLQARRRAVPSIESRSRRLAWSRPASSIGGSRRQGTARSRSTETRRRVRLRNAAAGSTRGSRGAFRLRRPRLRPVRPASSGHIQGLPTSWRPERRSTGSRRPEPNHGKPTIVERQDWIPRGHRLTSPPRKARFSVLFAERGPDRGHPWNNVDLAADFSPSSPRSRRRPRRLPLRSSCSPQTEASRASHSMKRRSNDSRSPSLAAGFFSRSPYDKLARPTRSSRGTSMASREEGWTPRGPDLHSSECHRWRDARAGAS